MLLTKIFLHCGEEGLCFMYVCMYACLHPRTRIHVQSSILYGRSGMTTYSYIEHKISELASSQRMIAFPPQNHKQTLDYFWGLICMNSLSYIHKTCFSIFLGIYKMEQQQYMGKSNARTKKLSKTSFWPRRESSIPSPHSKWTLRKAVEKI